MTLKLQFIVFVLVAILSISIVSAQTLIAGKVYDASYNNLVADARVEITCGTKTLTTQSLSDGTYAVRFENTVCPAGSIAEVYAEKGALTGESEGEVRECEENCDDDYVSVINLKIKDNTVPSNKVENGGSGRGGGGSRSTNPVLTFICGNGVCDSGETEETCASDCYTEPEAEEGTEESNPIELTPNGDTDDGSGITGAFIAIGNSISLPVLSGILGFLVILLIGHKIIQRRNKAGF